MMCLKIGQDLMCSVIDCKYNIDCVCKSKVGVTYELNEKGKQVLFCTQYKKDKTK